MKIFVKLEASENKGSKTIDLEDLDITKEEWDNMSDMEKQQAVERAVFDLPEQPFWMVESFEER